MLCELLCILYSIWCGGSMEKHPLWSCEYGVEVEYSRVLPPFAVVDHCYFQSMVINYLLCRMRNTESRYRYIVSSETGQFMRKVLLSVGGFQVWVAFRGCGGYSVLWGCQRFCWERRYGHRGGGCWLCVQCVYGIFEWCLDVLLSFGCVTPALCRWCGQRNVTYHGGIVRN